jgi:hypothetical protein
MRKLVLTGVLAAAALFAQGARAADDAAKERQEAREEAKEAAQATQEQAKEQAREQREKMKDQGTGSAEAGQRQAAAKPEKRHPMFDGKENFSVEGKIQKVSKNSITLQREELPPATLTISQHTKVELDGEQVSAQQLKQGQDVKASFNLRGDKPEAVEINAQKQQ